MIRAPLLTGVLVLSLAAPACAPLRSPPPTKPRGASRPPSPTPAAPAPPASAAPATIPPLRPEMPSEVERRLRDDAQRKLDETARRLRLIESRSLQLRERETFLLAQNFLDQARKALTAGEYERAANLAGKALTLADDLATTR